MQAVFFRTLARKGANLLRTVPENGPIIRSPLLKKVFSNLKDHIKVNSTESTTQSSNPYKKSTIVPRAIRPARLTSPTSGKSSIPYSNSHDASALRKEVLLNSSSAGNTQKEVAPQVNTDNTQKQGSNKPDWEPLLPDAVNALNSLLGSSESIADTDKLTNKLLNTKEWQGYAYSQGLLRTSNPVLSLDPQFKSFTAQVVNTLITARRFEEIPVQNEQAEIILNENDIPNFTNRDLYGPGHAPEVIVENPIPVLKESNLVTQVEFPLKIKETLGNEAVDTTDLKFELDQLVKLYHSNADDIEIVIVNVETKNDDSWLRQGLSIEADIKINGEDHHISAYAGPSN